MSGRNPRSLTEPPLQANAWTPTPGPLPTYVSPTMSPLSLIARAKSPVPKLGSAMLVEPLYSIAVYDAVNTVPVTLEPNGLAKVVDAADMQSELWNKSSTVVPVRTFWSLLQSSHQELIAEGANEHACVGRRPKSLA